MSLSDNQTDVFLNEEADNWFTRNFSNNVKEHQEDDLTLKYLLQNNCDHKHIVEVGCSDGWRLAELSKAYSCKLTGVEPSEKAIATGKQRYPDIIDFIHGTAAELSLQNESADVVIHGFCLYLCDRRELFKIAYETDRILKNGGVLLIVDFMPSIAYRNPYHHMPGLFSYKMNYANMFLWNPEYSLEYQQIDQLPGTEQRAISPDTRVGLTVLRKQAEFSYPESPYG